MTATVNEIQRAFNKPNLNTKPFVLCIDDNQDFLQILTYLIEALGYDLATSSNAEHGLEIARTAKPDIIFCDLGLPEMNGFDFAKEIRLDPMLANTPMIAISGLTNPDDIAEALASGFDNTLAKPVKFADVRTVLLQATEKHHD